MKNTIKGFVEGAFAITTGDKMKPGDHRRSKFRCKHFSDGYCCYLNRKCIGSSHCDLYDDGVPVFIREETFDYRLHPSYKRLMETLEGLKYKIPLDTSEGSVIEEYFHQIHQLSAEDAELARAQKKAYEKYLADVDLLKKHIREHNKNLRKKCLLTSLGIVTAPFCFIYYLCKKRNEAEESKKIPAVKKPDRELQQRLEKFDCEIEKTNAICDRTAQRSKSSADDGELSLAKIYFKEENYSQTAVHVQKAINHKHTKTMLWLAENCKTGPFYLSGDTHIFLWLYASYLGDRTASSLLEQAILRMESDSEIGQKFRKKAQKNFADQ